MKAKELLLWGQANLPFQPKDFLIWFVNFLDACQLFPKEDTLEVVTSIGKKLPNLSNQDWQRAMHEIFKLIFNFLLNILKTSKDPLLIFETFNFLTTFLQTFQFKNNFLKKDEFKNKMPGF